MPNTNFQTFHQMGNAINDVVRQATGRDNVQNIDMDFVTVAQRKRLVEEIITGNPVTFVTNIVGPLDYLIAQINPVQDLHGFDAPWVGGAGKNLLNNTSPSVTGNGQSFTLNSDGTVSVSGTATGYTPYEFSKLEIYDIRTQQIILSGLEETTNIVWDSVCIYDSTDALKYDLNVYDHSNPKTITLSNLTINPGYYLRIVVKRGTDAPVSGTIKPMVRLSSVTDATFAPYSNICPISGFTGVDIVRAGKNIVNPADARPGYIISSTTGAVGENADHLAYVGFIPVKPNAKYTLSATNIHTRAPGSTSGNAYVNVVEYSDADRTNFLRKLVNSTSNDSSYTFTISSDAHYIRFSVGVGASNVQLEIGENVSDFVPYTGCNEYNITFPSEAGTVYSGTLTINKDGSATLVVDKVLVTIDGTETYSVPTAQNAFFINDSKFSALAKTTADDVCSMFTVVSASGVSEMGNNTISRHTATTGLVYIKSDIFAGYTAEELSEYFTANNVQLCCGVNEPSTFELEAEAITTLLGVNNIWTDTGDVTVLNKNYEEVI